MTKAVHALEYMSPFLPRVLLPDMHAESRQMTFHDQSFTEFLRRLRQSDWAESKDATPYDCTFEAAQLRDVAFWESEKRSVGRTWFRSYAATIVNFSSDQLLSIGVLIRVVLDIQKARRSLSSYPQLETTARSWATVFLFCITWDLRLRINSSNSSVPFDPSTPT